MALNFPSSPSNGQIFTVGDRSWIYNSTLGAWEGGAEAVTPSSLGISAGADVTISAINAASTETTPVDGDFLPMVKTSAGNTLRRLSFLNSWVNYFKGKADALYVALTGNQTVAGNKTLSGQLELTGQAATNDTSAMTRTLTGKEAFYSIGVVRNVVYPPAFASSGTASNALIGAGDRLFNLISGTANSGWARASIARGINTNPAVTGSGIRFNKKVGASIAFTTNVGSFSDVGQVVRLIVGSNQTPAADGVDPITYRGFGIELKARGTSHDWRLFAHNGTAISYSAWTNTGMTSGGPSAGIMTLAVESDGAGNITGYFGADCTRTLSTLTITGAPTTLGALAQAFVDVQAANSTTGTSSIAVGGYDAKIYSE